MTACTKYNVAVGRFLLHKVCTGPRGDTKCEECKRIQASMFLSPIIFNLYSECLNSEALERSGDFKMGQVIRSVKYADELVLLAKEETVLQGMINGIIENGNCY
jgi:hypothetical protein